MELIKVAELIDDINETRNSVASNSKDELRVMRAMMNDTSYSVDVYGKDGKEGVYNPSEDMRGMISNIIKTTTHMPKAEADELATNYEFTKSDAQTMLNFSKEYVNTYLDTGRKFGFGGRSDRDIKIVKRVVEEHPNTYSKKIGVNDDGTNRYEQVVNGTIPRFTTVRVYSTCPSWV